MNFFIPTTLVAFVCLFFASTTPTLTAQTEKVRKIPFHGKVASVDTNAQTITLESKKAQRVFHLTSITRVIDGAGSPSTLAAAKAGEDVGGSYSKGSDGTMTLFSLRIGAKAGSKAEETAEAPVAPTPPAAPAPGSASITPAPAPPTTTADGPAPAKAKKQRFSGKIVSVDAAANTFVIHGMTLRVVSDTKITDSTGATMILSGLATGDKVSGTYVKSDGGTMTVTTLKKAK